jgi:hypothetical protein
VKFSPFNFQAPLAAGGVTLMAFNWLEFAVPHGKAAVKLSDIQWAGLPPVQTGLCGLAVAILAAFAIVNLLLTVVFLKDLAVWLAGGRGYAEFMGGPPSRITGIFVPVASLAMTMAVVLACAPFFMPAVSANVQKLMVPGLVVFAILLLTALSLEVSLLKRLLKEPPRVSGLNFVWLLDVFAFGLVSLAGTGLAAMANSRGIAWAAAAAAAVGIVVGSLLLVGKLSVLASVRRQSRALPEYQLQPAFFLLVPITCLYGVSYYRITLYLHKWFELNVKLPQHLLITSSYVVAVGWAVLTVYMLADYFRSYFRRSEYFPTQWAMV